MNSGISRAQALPRALALLVLATGILFLAPQASAQAAVVDDAITAVELTPADGDIDDEIRVDLTWCVPDGSRAGDTFTLTLPREIDVKVPGFPLNDPSGDRVADATIAAKDEAATPPVRSQVVTFTLTSFAERHENVCGTAWFRSWYDQDEIQAGTTTRIEFVAGGRVFQQQVKPTENADIHLEAKADKWGDWSNEAQTNAGWELVTPSAPDSSWDGTSPLVITDTAPTGMDFDCASVKVRLAHGWSYWGVDSSKYAVDCGPDRLRVTYTGPVAKEYYLYLRYSTNVTDKTLNRYTNSAGVLLPHAAQPVQVSDDLDRRGVRTEPSKRGSWVDRINQSAINWTIQTPDAPAAGWAGGARIVDHAQAGQKFRCDSLKVELVTQGVGIETLDPASLGSCSASDLNLSYTRALTAGQWLRVQIVTDVTDRALSAYDNTADITMNGQTTEAKATRVQRSDAGGNGKGDIPTATPTDGPGSGNSGTQAPTEGPTPGSGETAATGSGSGSGQPVTPVQGAPAAAAAGSGTQTPTKPEATPEVLPNTGGPQFGLLLAGLALVAGGAGFVLRNRKVAS